MAFKRFWHKSYVSAVPPEADIEKITLPEVLERNVERFPSNTTMNFMGKKISFREFNSLVNRFANALVDLGVKKGDMVAMLLPNIPQMIIAISLSPPENLCRFCDVLIAHIHKVFDGKVEKRPIEYFLGFLRNPPLLYNFVSRYFAGIEEPLKLRQQRFHRQYFAHPLEDLTDKRGMGSPAKGPGKHIKGQLQRFELFTFRKSRI